MTREIATLENFDLSVLLSSRARFRILRAICQAKTPMHLRQLEVTTGLAIRSVQVAVNGLEKESVLRKVKRNKHLMISLNRRHPAADILIEIFALLYTTWLRHRARGLNKKAKASFEFSVQAREMIRKAKRA